MPICQRGGLFCIDNYGAIWYNYNIRLVRENDFVAIANEYGDLVAEYTYDAWGCVLYINEYLHDCIGAINPIRYRSYYYDGETGFYYLQTRYYDPAIRRFINADGYVNANGDILGFNMYTYCGNNPVMGYDPTGEVNWKNIAIAFVAVAFATAIVAITVSTAGLGTAAVAGAIIGGATSGTAEIIHQCNTKGSDNLDFNDVFIESTAGAFMGTFDGISSTFKTIGAQMGSKFAKIATGTVAAMAHTANDTNDISTILQSGAKSISTGSIMQSVFMFFGSRGSGTYGLGSALITAGGRYVSNTMRHYKNEIVDFGIHMGKEFVDFTKAAGNFYWYIIRRGFNAG